MLKAYLIMAVGGAMLSGLLLVMTVFKFGDKYSRHPLSRIQRILNNLVLFLVGSTLFGIVGVVGYLDDWGEPATMIVAAAVAFAPAFLITLFRQLDAERRFAHLAVGRTGITPQGVPGGKKGIGTVVVKIRARDMEFRAVAAQDEIPAGAEVRVLKVVAPDTVEVVAEVDMDQVWQSARHTKHDKGTQGVQQDE